jgi:WavE lipopolysaccharide synthesis
MIHGTRPDKRNREFRTIRVRPRRDLARHDRWRPDGRSDTAIVMQGPIVRSYDFTFETVRRYRTNFPNAPIIVSTWNSDLGAVAERIRALGAIVVSQDLPLTPGVQNSNLQMMSAFRGVSEAASLGATHVVKTRTDQRIYSERLLGLLHSILVTYPLDGNQGTQEQRVVGLSLNTFAYRMYGLSDMFTFGAVKDISRYWDGSLDERNRPPIAEARNHREFAQAVVCEVRYCSSFLARTGWEVKWTLEDSWRALANRFLVLDASSVDLYWPKYSDREERWRAYDGNPRFQEVDFALWSMMRHGCVVPDEGILDDPWS